MRFYVDFHSKRMFGLMIQVVNPGVIPGSLENNPSYNEYPINGCESGCESCCESYGFHMCSYGFHMLSYGFHTIFFFFLYPNAARA